jgi:AcrR family transcriptional regulator
MARATSTSRATDARRQALLDAALVLFGRYGYRRTSIDDIAREAGVAKGTVYLYVESKEALFRELSRELLDRVIADARAAMAAPGPLEKRLQAVLGAKFAFFHDLLARSPHASELLDSKSRLCAELFAAGDAAYLQVLVDTLAGATRRREISPKQHGLAVGDVAALLMAGAQGIDATTGVSLSGDAFRARLAVLVRVVVAGLVPR